MAGESVALNITADKSRAKGRARIHKRNHTAVFRKREPSAVSAYAEHRQGSASQRALIESGEVLIKLVPQIKSTCRSRSRALYKNIFLNFSEKISLKRLFFWGALCYT